MKKILSPLRQAIEKYELIDEGDKIAICLSGGKDSVTLLHGMKRLQMFYPKHFDLIAITVNPGFENFDCTLLKKMCDDLEIPFYTENSHAKEIVFDLRKEKNPCSLCANLRRGLINTIAKDNGCNKIALGHTQDDIIETFLMNLFYNGAIDTMTPKAYMDRSQITLIRPLAMTNEKQTKGFVKRNDIQIMSKVCPQDGYTKREEIKNFILSKTLEIPTFRANLIGAINRNIQGFKEYEANGKNKN